MYWPLCPILGGDCVLGNNLTCATSYALHILLARLKSNFDCS